MMIEVNEADDDDNSTEILEYSDTNIQHRIRLKETTTKTATTTTLTTTTPTMTSSIPLHSTLADTERDELLDSGTFI